MPAVLARVLPLVDWVAMDVKAEWDEHEGVTRTRTSGRRAKESMYLILASGVDCRFHTISGNAQVEKRGHG